MDVEDNHTLVITSHETWVIVYYAIWLGLTNLVIGISLASRLPSWGLYVLFVIITIGSLLMTSTYRTGQASIDYTLGSTLASNIFNALHLLVLVDPLKRYRHRLDDPREGPNGLPWYKRVYWACCVCASVRGIGWNYQVPHCPQPPHMNRFRFCFYALRQIPFYFFLHDLAQTIVQTAPFLNQFRSDRQTSSFYSLSFIQRGVCAWSFIVGCYAGIQLIYYAGALVLVGCGWYESEDYPALFGDLRDTYSVRNFWGKTWHQYVRRFATSPGKALTHILGIQPKSTPGVLIQLYIVFLVSALTHSLGDYMVAPALYGTSIPFFVVQALGITFEEIVKVLVRQNKLARSFILERPWIWRGVGYVWVVFWFAWTAPLMAEPAMRVGFDKERWFPVSPARTFAAIIS